MQLALAGTEFNIEPGPPWWSVDPKQEWPDGLVEQFYVSRDTPSTWDAVYGDRRTELVCIGRELDHEAARAQLEACCLTMEEMGTMGVIEVMDEQTQGHIYAATAGRAERVCRALGRVILKIWGVQF